jgi:hypothetical protein
MRRCAILLVFVLAAAGVAAQAQTAPAAFGFGVAVPAALPVDLHNSFSYLTAEFFPDPNLTFLGAIGTYPADFPDLTEFDGSLLLKGWLGPVISVYGGAGLAFQAEWLAPGWAWHPFMVVQAGAELWLNESFAVRAQVRSLDPFPLSWTLHPQVSLALLVAFGSARPPGPSPQNLWSAWLLVGLGVAALLAYYPRS